MVTSSVDVEHNPLRHGRIWLLTSLHAVNDIYGGAVRSLLPFFVLYAGYSYAAVGGLALAVTVLSSVAQPVLGYLCDRYNIRWLTLAGLMASAIGVSMSGLLTDSYTMVFIAIAFAGLGSAAYHPAGTAEAREIGGSSSRAMSVFIVGGNIGGAIAPSAVVIAVGAGHLNNTVWLLAPAIVMGALYFVSMNRYRRGLREAAAQADAETGTSSQRSVAPATDDWKGFAWLVAVILGWSIVNVSKSVFMPLFAVEKFGISAEQSAVVLTLLAIGGIFGTLLGGWLADRWGRLPVVRLGYLLAAIGTFLMFLAPTYGLFLAATVFASNAIFLPFAIHLTLAHSYLPNRIGLASGMTLGLGASIGGIASPLLGALGEATDLGVVLFILASTLLVVFAFSLVLKERVLTTNVSSAAARVDDENSQTPRTD